MKWRVLILLSFALCMSAAFGQSDSMIHVKEFPGDTVGAKVAAAQLTCNPDTAIPCILVIDASLAAAATGTMPALCAQCTLLDYRNPANLSGFELSPMCDVRTFGGVADNATPIDTALSACYLAIYGKKSATILLPCASPAGGCYLANGILFGGVLSGTKELTIKIQGTLRLGSTLIPPDNTTIICDGGATPGQFQSTGQTCSITAPQAAGTVGTATTASASYQQFTPTFSVGSAGNLPSQSAFSVAGTTTCAISAISQTGSTVTASFSGACHIPAGTTITVDGVSDSTFDGSDIMATSANYPSQTLKWIAQTGTNRSSSGGTVTGFNEDSYETVRVWNVGNGVYKSAFVHNHSASDVWGAVAIAPPDDTYDHHDFQDISVTGCYGACFWGSHIANVALKNMAFGVQNWMPAIPVEMSSAWWFTISNSSLLPTLCHSGPVGCPTQSYPYGFRCSGESAFLNPSGEGCGGDMSQINENTVIGGGIKLDTNGVSQQVGGIDVRDVTIEQPINNAVTIDQSSASGVRPVSFSNVFLQDNFMGYAPNFIDYLGSRGPIDGEFILNNMNTVISQSIAGPNYYGRILMNGVDYYQGGINNPIGRGVSPGTINDGNITRTELDGIGASMGVTLMPYATAPVASSPLSWSCVGTGCSVLTGVRDPVGGTTAGEIDSGTSGNSYSIIYSPTMSTTTGDYILAGAWVRSGANNPATVSSSISPAGIYIFSNGTDYLTQNWSSFQQKVNGDWWHPVVALIHVQSGESTAHNLQMRLYGGNANGVGNQFWMPFFIYVPASANVPIDELERWRQQLLHGAVPGGIPAGTGVTILPIKSLSTIDAAGFLCNGVAGASGQYLTATGTGCSWASSSGGSGVSTGLWSFTLGSYVVTNVAPQLWIPSASHTIISISGRAQNGTPVAISCTTTSPVVTIYDLTSSTPLASVTLSNNANGIYSKTGMSVPVSAGHQIEIYDSVLGVGCSPNLSTGGGGTVEYE
jgi:hypothetical protein